jgi:5-methyltetrahydropteroyltriglutamate--homocysteine methyltransferase
MVQSSVLGFPRMGVLRDLKKATEAYWGGKISRDELLAEGKRLRLAHWKLQKESGVDIIPSNDFAFYDQVLDHIQLFNVRPNRSIAPNTRSYYSLGYPRAVLEAWP